MSRVRAVVYNHNYEAAWDEFVQNAKNKHFFFYRKYMEYHSDRFNDLSLMFINDKDKIVALLPASRHDNTLISHGGLTFGGVLSNESMSTELMLEIFNELYKFCKEKRIIKLLYKCMPYIYYKYPSEEEKYALFIHNAKLIRRDVSTTIYLPCRYKYKKLRKRMINKAHNNGVEVKESKNFRAFIDLVNSVLSKYHNTSAVHTGAELELLASRFPKNIHLYIAELNGELLAGTVVFENDDVVHTQYLANSGKGRALGALDCVIDYLVTEKYAKSTYLDFGISNEQQGRYLNKGLIEQKEGFGARAVVHDFYEWDIE
ncbi:GNAT family N-acetyltransferase [Selenomonas caprae]|uniref:GNAT family N-acetyltransferase n=1 Tax=Selenomonas caprae TaxID=2606905 RepID=A0A5D6WS51_9FIRM|nr:GNAT family N-acetyltransferase [Selenomonas caprae]TYZ29949.1 GNAT family N-acetyltransferase [Selenomonas caprae]